ncbi:MAG: metal-dependent hydrolase [Methanobacteriota archaeon]
MKITWRGHSFFELECKGGLKLAIDPFCENGLTRTMPRDVKADLVLLTHGHADHVGSTKEIGRPVVAIYELANHCQSTLGIRDATGMNIGGTLQKSGVRVSMTDARHSAGAGPMGDVYAGNPCGFVIDDGETRFYHAGDTGLFGDMRSVVRDVLRPTIAAVPIGDLYTMGPEHAAIAVEWLGVPAAIPMHYNTFPAIRQDAKKFADLVGKKADVLVPAVDEPLDHR